MELIKGNKPESCKHCKEGRLDGKPCDYKTCLCKCHTKGVAAIEKIDSQNPRIEKRRIAIEATSFELLDNFIDDIEIEKKDK